MLDGAMSATPTIHHRHGGLQARLCECICISVFLSRNFESNDVDMEYQNEELRKNFAVDKVNPVCRRRTALIRKWQSADGGLGDGSVRIQGGVWGRWFFY